MSETRLTIADLWHHLLAGLRHEAEARLVAPIGGDQSVCTDPVYGAALDAWQTWRRHEDATADQPQPAATVTDAIDDADGVDEYASPHRNRQCPGCGEPQHRLGREFPWFHGATGRVECAAAAELLDDPCAVEPGGDRW